MADTDLNKMREAMLAFHESQGNTEEVERLKAEWAKDEEIRQIRESYFTGEVPPGDDRPNMVRTDEDWKRLGIHDERNMEWLADPRGEWEGFERGVQIRPAFDGTEHPKNYGNGGVEMWFTLKGPHGGTESFIFTGWDLQHVHERNWHIMRGMNRRAINGGAICFHSPREPEWSKHSESGGLGEPTDGCLLTSTGSCWSDCSYTAGDDFAEAIVTKGWRGAWAYLLDWYRTEFEGFGDCAPYVPLLSRHAPGMRELARERRLAA